MEKVEGFGAEDLPCAVIIRDLMMMRGTRRGTEEQEVRIKL